MRLDRILLASGNAKKLLELGEWLAPLGLNVVSPDDVGGLPEVVEDRDTFAGNAAKKALSAAAHTGLWSLADDSGLEVDALNGAPGVYSARFAGEPSNDDANNALLLERMAQVSEPERGAGFVCALALASPGTAGSAPEIQLNCEGRVRGSILDGPRGEGGFGYDPLFLFTEPGFEHTGRAFGELDRSQKATISHRARALQIFRDRLPELLGAARKA